MSDQLTEFWDFFHKKDFAKAQISYDQLKDSDKQAILAELFQKSEHSRMPDIISVLYRELHEQKTFDDFHKAWLPGKEWCHPLEKAGQTFQQFFPAPTRVFNAINLENPKEIISVGFTWIENEEQRDAMSKIATGNNQANQDRHNNIAEVANKVSAKLYEAKTSDDLGIPF